MKYRLYEGNGKAVYLIGVTDSGKSIGLSENDIYSSNHLARAKLTTAQAAKKNFDACTFALTFKLEERQDQ